MTVFWERVDIRGPDDCWISSHPRANSYGHRIYCEKGKPVLAHRQAYKLHHGSLPVGGPTAHGAVIMHTCDNPACCNPAHLRAGSQLDNIRDMKEKGRANPPKTLSGERNPNAKLKDSDLPVIREMYASGMLQREIGERYGVTQVRISQVIRST